MEIRDRKLWEFEFWFKVIQVEEGEERYHVWFCVHFVLRIIMPSARRATAHSCGFVDTHFSILTNKFSIYSRTPCPGSYVKKEGSIIPLRRFPRMHVSRKMKQNILSNVSPCVRN